MVWNADQNNPAAHAFRTLMTDWLARKNGKQPLVPAGR